MTPGGLYYDHDGLGGDQRVQIATLSHKPTITHDDFHIYIL